MRRVVNIVVTCTSRKRLRPARALCLRSVRLSNGQRRAELWIERLRTKESAISVAGDLYCGEHWTVVRSLPEEAKKVGIQARLWICSAGYGLISPDSLIKSYSATFAAGDLDAVAKMGTATERRSAVQQWWASLCRWRGPGPENIRTILGIAQECPNSPLVVVGSPGYVQAVGADLTRAAKAMSKGDLLMIVSAGSRRHDALGEHFLPCDARLQSVLGGTRASLNARIVKRLLGRAGRMELTLPKARQYLSSLLRKQPSVSGSARIPMADSELRQFIRAQLQKCGSESHSRLLRRLRDSGRACEQARFAALFREVIAGKGKR